MRLLRKSLSLLLSAVLTIGVFSAVPFSADAADAPEPAGEATAFPKSFDLRDRGVVTPVKKQDPWGTCWAFSAIAAAETSILSSMGSTYSETGLDLSERYLAWYVDKPVTEDISASQAGEGLTMYDQEAGPNNIFTFGGREKCAGTLFAQGIGPVAEDAYPYKGAEGRLAYEDLLVNKEAYIEKDIAGMREDIRFKWETEEGLRSIAEEDYEYELAKYAEYDAYSPFDDWSIADADEPGSGRLSGSPYTLTDNNTFIYWVNSDTSYTRLLDLYEKEPLYTQGYYSLYQDSIDQMKNELYSGRGMSVRIDISDDRINPETWAMYSARGLTGNNPHEVCIVGWDDDYPAGNFTHDKDIYGEPVDASKTTPPGNGAWIVKNSWGSETDLIPGGLTGADGAAKDANANDWGIVDESGRHTGYFYLSYYDASIDCPESFAFDIRENHDYENALQLDYLPASTTEWTSTLESPMWEANIFTLDKDMRINEVATRVGMSDTVPVSGFTVTFDLYKLNEGAVTPDDGEHIASCTRFFRSEGYHRTALDEPVYLKAGDRLGIVVQQSHTFDNDITMYCASAQETMGKSAIHRDPLYGIPVMNEGESFWRVEGVTDREEAADGGWLDMTAPMSKELLYFLMPELKESASMSQYYERDAVGKPINDFYMIDNFCIKVFGEPTAEEPAGSCLLGDADGDGSVTILDVTMIQKYIAEFNMPGSFVPKACDTNGDGKVTILDATAIQRWLAELPSNDQIGKPLA